MPSLLVQVKAKMAIHAHEKVRGLLEGEYGSVFKGRSMDFDDLREYIPGDDVKDIDWKASARSNGTLIRRYVAIRKHNILLVVNTGRSMAATSDTGDNKRDVSVMTAGVLSYIAMKHGDLVGLVAGDVQSTRYFPFKGTSVHVEHMLQHIQSATSLEAAEGSIVRQLEYITRNMRRRMMLIIISDESQPDPQLESLLRRLRAQHELLWVTIGDTSGLQADTEFYDIDEQAVLPAFIRKNAALRQAFIDAAARDEADQTRTLERLGIMRQRIAGDADVVSGLFRLLERKRHVK